MKLDQWIQGGKDFQSQQLEQGLPAPDDAGIFGLSLSEADSDLVILPVAWGTNLDGDEATNETR